MFYLSAVAMHPKEGKFLPYYFSHFGELTTVEKIATVITGGGYALARSHWDLGRVGDDSWMHKAIAVIECCPLVGGIFLLIEQLIVAVLWSLVGGKLSNSDAKSLAAFQTHLDKEHKYYSISDIVREDLPNLAPATQDQQRTKFGVAGMISNKQTKREMMGIDVTPANQKLAVLLSNIKHLSHLERVKQLYEFSKTLPVQGQKEMVHEMIIKIAKEDVKSFEPLEAQISEGMTILWQISMETSTLLYNKICQNFTQLAYLYGMTTK